MSEWSTKRLNQLADFHKGRKVETSAYEREGFAPYLGASAISGGAEEYGEARFGVLARPGQILMLWDGERSGLVGKARHGVISSTVMRLSVKEEVEGEFLYYALHSKFDWIQNRRAGTGVPHVPKDLGRILSILFPRSKHEQRRIVKILSTVDAAIEQTDQLIAKWQQIKKGLMNDLFTRGVTADGQLRPSRANAADRYKETPLGCIPREWEVAKLRDKSRPGESHIKTGPFGTTLKGEHWVQHGHPVVTIGALGEGELLPDALLFVSKATAARLRDYQLAPGDVVFSRVADVGRSAVIQAEHDGWIMSSNLMRIRLDTKLIVPGYLQTQFAFDSRLKAQIRIKLNSGGRDVANGQILNQLLFAWPPREEQEFALRRMEATDQNRRSLSDQRSKLLKAKQGLMHDLLTGRVPVKISQES